jgi:hypothetical protein
MNELIERFGTRESVIQLLSDGSIFSVDVLTTKTDEEIVELWNSLEMDEWLEVLQWEEHCKR